jgi:hypothetical protein
MRILWEMARFIFVEILRWARMSLIFWFRFSRKRIIVHLKRLRKKSVCLKSLNALLRNYGDDSH